jgi:hypothetical protein
LQKQGGPAVKTEAAERNDLAVGPFVHTPIPCRSSYVPMAELALPNRFCKFWNFYRRFGDAGRRQTNPQAQKEMPFRREAGAVKHFSALRGLVAFAVGIGLHQPRPTCRVG